MEALGDILGELRRDGRAVFLLGFHARVREVLSKAHWFHEVAAFPTYGALLGHLRRVRAEGGDYAAPPAGAHGHEGQQPHGATAVHLPPPATPAAPPAAAGAGTGLELGSPAPAAAAAVAPTGTSAYSYSAMLLSPSPAKRPATTGEGEGAGGVPVSKEQVLDEWK